MNKKFFVLKGLNFRIDFDGAAQPGLGRGHKSFPKSPSSATVRSFNFDKSIFQLKNYKWHQFDPFSDTEEENEGIKREMAEMKKNNGDDSGEVFF